MKTFLTTLLLVLTAGLALAQQNPRWIRYQAISPDGRQIAFTYKGDLYRVPVTGGEARQLTFHTSHDFMPVWSNDGSRIAFASDRYGNFDVYIMDALGGQAERLTYHSNDELPYSFTADNAQVLFGASRQDLASHRQYPAGYLPELYQVPASGGRVDQVFTIPAEYVQVSADGNTMVYHDRVGGENEWRKHHRSSVARDIWSYDAATNTHTQLTTFEGENRQPVFNADETGVYYLSDESGTFNVWFMSLENPADRRQVTFFEVHPVRFLSHANGVLSFGFDGELYTLREGGEPEKVNVIIRTQPVANADRFIDINGGVQEMAISPNGKEIAFIARGEVFVTATDGEFTKRITNTPTREQFVTWSADGNSVVYAGERDGKWSLFKTERVRPEAEPFFFASTLLQESMLFEEDADVYDAAFSPDGKQIAYIYNRRFFRVRDLESGRTRDLLTPADLYHMNETEHYFTWSPDSKWIAFGWDPVLHRSEVLLLAADGSERVNLTESGYYDVMPKWIGDGDRILFFSNRDGLRSYATSGSTERDAYMLFMNQEAWDRHNLSEAEFKLTQEVEKALKKEDDDDDEDEEEATEQVEFDLEHVRDRLARLTIHSSSLSDAVLSKDGEKLYYLTSFEGNANLWETNIRTRETKQLIRLNTRWGQLMWDKDMENLYLLSGGSISKLNLSAGSSSRISISGEMEYDAVAEREAMFDIIALRVTNIFYEPTFHGIDWDAMTEHYRRYLPHLGNSYEFAEMAAELLGELNVSHSGARYSGSIDNADATASLGVFMDYAHEGNGIRIAEVITGGPLDRAAFDLEPGMVIERIDGELITPDQDIARFLNRKAGEFVLLDITGPGRNDRKQITVKPISLGEERRLLYQRFVRMNEREVHERSGGRLGYVHIPGMSDGPYRNVFSEMMGRWVDREAVVVDARFNGGGDLVADLAMFFTGVKFNTYATADRDVGGEPTSRWTKPTISLYNEAMYSDGHCYAEMYRELGIGVTVGMPVPGTCSFAAWAGLPDGTRWGVVPVSARNKADQWMENLQTEPDIRVKNMPGVIDAGRDEQLERAIEEMLRQLDAE
ncbi:MAG: Periplasmic protease [Bacteroidetes bacterium HLUCCA01]|nr:MAG: Periplasmic protease [Bacteroidetes bacterium HLUCCA01]